MRTWAENKWEDLRTNFWFVPGLMVVAAVGGAVLMLGIDATVVTAGTWINFGGVESIRVLLGVLAGSLATALSVVFSITVVALTLAASQLGPRLLRTFMRDRANQVVLGLFVSTFTYCLITLMSLGKVETSPETPDVTIFVGFLLTLVSLAVLVYFIHHMAESIQAPNIILAVSSELSGVIEREFPEKIGQGAEEEEDETSEPTPELPAKAGEVTAGEDEYVQAIDLGGLVAVATDQDLVIEVTHRPGDFVVRGEPLAVVYGADALEYVVEKRIRESMRTAFILGVRRTSVQDVEYVLTQLVEIAIRALSPGINDPQTAMTCIARLEAALVRLSERRMPPAEQYDEDGNLRVVLDRTSFAGILDGAFNQIRQHARGDAAVTIRLLEALKTLAEFARTSSQRRAVWRHATMVHRSAQDLPEPMDRADAKRRFEAIEKLLQPVPRLPAEGNAPHSP